MHRRTLLGDGFRIVARVAGIDHRPPAVQWLRFLGANALGGAVNYGVYAALVTFSAAVAALTLGFIIAERLFQ